MQNAKAYHHGDLRAELLRAARVKLNADGYETLSLRELARDLGVARSAPYAHFANRDALLLALIAQGAQDLLTGFEAARQLPLRPEQRLAEACRAHLDFARGDPEMYRLLLMAPVEPDADTLINPEQTLAVFEGLIGDVMQCIDLAIVRPIAVACLSALHGYCMLRIHRRLMPDVDPAVLAGQIIAATVRLAQTAPA